MNGIPLSISDAYSSKNRTVIPSGIPLTIMPEISLPGFEVCLYSLWYLKAQGNNIEITAVKRLIIRSWRHLVSKQGAATACYDHAESHALDEPIRHIYLPAILTQQGRKRISF